MPLGRDRIYSGFREPCSLPCDFEGDGKDGSVLVFRAHAREVFWCEAVVNVLAKVLYCKVVRFDLVDMILIFVGVFYGHLLP